MRIFIQNLSSVYVVNALNGVLGVLLVPYTMNFLGVEGYGVFSIFSLLTGYLMLVELGIGKNLVRKLAKESSPEHLKECLRDASGLYLSLCIIILISLPALVYLVSNFLFPTKSQYVGMVQVITIFAAIDYLLSIPTSMIQATCVSRQDFKKYSQFAMISGFYRYALTFIGVALFARPDLAVAILLLRRVIDIPLALLLMGRLPAGSWHPRFDLHGLKAWISQSTALSLTQLFQLSVISVGSVLVNRWFGLGALGNYRAAFDLASKVWFLSNAMGLVVFPKFVKMVNSEVDKRELYRKLPNILRYSWSIFTALSLVGTLATPLLLNLMNLGKVEIQTIFIPMLIGVSLNAHANLSYELLQAQGRYIGAGIVSFVSLCLMTLVFLALKDYLGLAAIGWSWAISQLIYAIITDHITLRSTQSSPVLYLKDCLFKFATVLTCLIPAVGVMGHVSKDLILASCLVYSIILILVLFPRKASSSEQREAV